VTADGVKIPAENRLGGDGEGFAIMMGTVLPHFNLMIAAGSLGLMAGGLRRSIAHVSSARYAHLDNSLADLPTIRAYVARMQVKTDMVRALLHDAADAVEGGREDAMLRVLESKAAAGEAAGEVLDMAMRVCGGQAFRRDVGVERFFRDARAAGVMAPTTDQLYDFIGKAVCGLELF
jgi:alkylation response protein AidB-like acyl-CoA dehydrogenase